MHLFSPESGAGCWLESKLTCLKICAQWSVMILKEWLSSNWFQAHIFQDRVQEMVERFSNASLLLFWIWCMKFHLKELININCVSITSQTFRMLTTLDDVEIDHNSPRQLALSSEFGFPASRQAALCLMLKGILWTQRQCIVLQSWHCVSPFVCFDPKIEGTLRGARWILWVNSTDSKYCLGVKLV